eukprot:scaffold162293_cov18-Tisochrysis_lutea.AAC.1
MVQMGGFKSVHNIDYCQIVINQMRGLHQAIEGLSYAVADARWALGHNSSAPSLQNSRAMPEIPATSFDFVLDKGTLDANVSGEGGIANGQAISQEVYRVIKPGGHFLVVSHASPEARLP